MLNDIIIYVNISVSYILCRQALKLTECDYRKKNTDKEQVF